MAFIPTIAALDALALIASALPKINPPTPIYAIVASDTFIPLTVPTSWLEFSAKYETQTSDYPVETGAYAIFNKVRRPQQVNVQVVKDGSDVARFAWLAAIQQQEAQSPTQLYTIISPQLIATDYALTGLSYETRQDRGQNRLYLNLQFSEIPQIASSLGNYSNVLEAIAAPVQQLGQVYTNAVKAVDTLRVNAQSFILG